MKAHATATGLLADAQILFGGSDDKLSQFIEAAIEAAVAAQKKVAPAAPPAAT